MSDRQPICRECHFVLPIYNKEHKSVMQHHHTLRKELLDGFGGFIETGVSMSCHGDNDKILSNSANKYSVPVKLRYCSELRKLAVKYGHLMDLDMVYFVDNIGNAELVDLLNPNDKDNFPWLAA